MIKRVIAPVLRAIAKKMPVISITGPRQSGKTTLVKQCFPAYDYVNLEDPGIREYAISDPREFLAQFKKGVIIDEPQHVPELFSYIQVISDESGKPGQFILTGSQNFLMLEKITQSLAGRVAIYNLLPLSISELTAEGILGGKYEPLLRKGFYPRLYDKKLKPEELYPSYVQTYIERDVRQMINIGNINAFQKLLKFCAGRIGQMVNYVSIANDLGIDQKTVKQWMSVMEASFILFFLYPHSENYNKRLVKSPKLYFYDTGLAAWLLNIQNEKEMEHNFFRGPLFENMIIADIMKIFLNKGIRPRLYFWRDKTGHEVDLLIENGTSITPVEIKSGKTINTSFFDGLNYYNSLSGKKTKNSFLIYGGNESYKQSAANVLSWQDIHKAVL